MKTANRLALSTATLLASVWTVPGAFAEEPVRSETVKFYDLKVDTPASVQALYSRIHAAAKHVCADDDPVMQAGVIACTSRAEERAIQTLNLPQLTAYYQKRSGNQPPRLAQR
jgi:UrcA family protein